MFGDNTDQSTAAPATDNVVNPSPDAPASADSTTPSAPDMSFPSVPSSDPTASTPVADTAAPNPVATPSPMDDTSLADDTATASAPETLPTPVPDAAAPAELLGSDEMAQDDTPTDDMSPAPSDDTSMTDTPTDDMTSSDTADNTPAEPASEELIDIKRQALEDLGPLVDKLDQSAEERFRTTMMLIQASDNQALVKQAFDAAQKIEDDKERAQALLDVINEINYFTTQKKD